MSSTPYQKYVNRMKLVIKTMKLKTTENAPDLPAWEWIHRLLTRLGAEGMSSEESDVEGGMHPVFHRKLMPWRRDVNEIMELLDKGQQLDVDIWSTQGLKPVPRLSSGFFNKRRAVANLPRELYDDDWFKGLSVSERKKLDVSGEPFDWLTLCW